jgi:regulator of sigma E protease
LISLFHACLAIFGLGFLVFIHELGHYFVALRQGMRVEAFAVGFGKPLLKWRGKNGVEWRICILPFGGYVKIAGMQKEGNVEPSQIPDGFFGKTPLQRIKVAIAGPLVNIAFALIVFSFLWISGGRVKSFSEFTHHVGWVDPSSELYKNGVRPGALIQEYDGRPFTGFKDLLVASIMKNETVQIAGDKIDPLTGNKTPFNYTLKTYQNPDAIGREKLSTIGVLSPAKYLIFPGGELLAGSPVSHSGIQPKDRILWVNGEVVYSHQQLTALTNEPSVLLTVKRGDEVFLAKTPRVLLSDLKLSGSERGEIDDWQHEAGLTVRFDDLYFIPYNLSPTLEVEGRLQFIDQFDSEREYGNLDSKALEEGDQILAVNGKPISSPYEFLTDLQTHRILMIIERNPSFASKVSALQADEDLNAYSVKDLQKITASIGTDALVSSSGSLHLLSPIEPKPLKNFSLTDEQRSRLIQEFALSKKQAESIQDPHQRQAALLALEKGQNRAVLGLPLIDREIQYNPTPLMQFKEVLKDTYRTLKGLFSGAASPKYVAGPVGIVQIVHQSWMLGIKEAFYWLGLISLNLGIMNLLPLPVLDGGHIVLSFVEMITRRPLKAKTMERLIVPFVVLLIGFFIFVTYNDISRLFSKFF